MIALHDFEGLIVHIALDASSRLNVVVILEKFVELVKVLPHVIHRDLTVLIEVKPHPVVADKDLNVGVSLLNVFYKFILTFLHDFKKYSDKVSCVIIKKYNFLIEFANFLDDFASFGLNIFILTNIVNIRISHFVGFALLNIFEAFAAFKKPQVE